MRLPWLSQDEAIKIWNARNTNAEFDYGKVQPDFIGEDDNDLSDIELYELVDDLQTVMARYEGKNITKALGGQIDREVIKPTHSHLKSFGTPYQLSQLGFWTWLSNLAHDGFFWNFIKWRYDSDQVINWGITGQARIVEVYFFRAWLRGHKMYDADLSNPYKYAEKGASDVWRSHLLRVEFGRDREFVKAFLDTIYDEDNKTLIGTTELRKRVIPALREWSSMASFSNLSYEECVAIIDKLRTEDL